MDILVRSAIDVFDAFPGVMHSPQTAGVDPSAVRLMPAPRRRSIPLSLACPAAGRQASFFGNWYDGDMTRSEDPFTLEKQKMRRLAKISLTRVSPTERTTDSIALTNRICRLPEWQDASEVLAFASMPEEVDTGALIERAAIQGLPVYLPRVEDDRMGFHLIRDAGDLQPGVYGIREPNGESPAFLQGGPGTLVLCPGLAFDDSGNRLGRGKAYYDRFLSSLDRRKCTVVGICFERQIERIVPAGAGDQPMDLVVTEARTIVPDNRPPKKS